MQIKATIDWVLGVKWSGMKITPLPDDADLIKPVLYYYVYVFC